MAQGGKVKFVAKIITIIDRINSAVGKCTAWLSGVLVLVVCYDVFTRYFLKKSSIAIFELEWHIFSILFLLAAAYTLKCDSHVRVDVFYSRFSPKVKAAINLIGSIIFLIPFCILIIWASKNFVLMSYNLMETSPDPGGLPYRYILKLMIPVGFSFILLQGVSLTLRSFCELIDYPVNDNDSEKEQENA